MTSLVQLSERSSSPASSSPAPLVLANLDQAEMAAALARFGVRPDVARRVFAAVHRDGVRSIVAAQPRIRDLSRKVAEAIDAEATWPTLEVLERRRSPDGFLKYLFRLPDGPEIEAVRIPLPDPAVARALKVAGPAAGAPPTTAGTAGEVVGEEVRSTQGRGLTALPTAKYTVCLSSQAGCALACDFCSTGRLGGIRSLSTWEIVAQLQHIASEADHPIRGVVFMGMGEPLLNYANVTRAGRIFSSPAGRAISARAISISTAGVVPAIRRYIDEQQPFRLIFSLGAPNGAQRAALMPIERRWPLEELVPLIREYARVSRQRVTIAYVAIGGAHSNLTPEHARQLAALLADIPIKLNLIDVSDEGGQYQPPSAEELARFRDAADRELRVPVVRRYSGGREIGAACGTLSASRRGGTALGPG